MNRSRKSDQRRAGVTLVEMMVASAILLVVISGFIMGFTVMRRSATFASDTMRAMHLARQGIETLSACGYDDSRLAVGTRSLSSLGISNSYTVALNPTYGSTKDVSMTVYYTIPGRVKVMTVNYSSSFTRGLH